MDEFLKNAEDEAYEMYEKLSIEYDDLENITDEDESEDAYNLVDNYHEATDALYDLYWAIKNYRENRS